MIKALLRRQREGDLREMENCAATREGYQRREREDTTIVIFFLKIVNRVQYDLLRTSTFRMKKIQVFTFKSK